MVIPLSVLPLALILATHLALGSGVAGRIGCRGLPPLEERLLGAGLASGSLRCLSWYLASLGGWTRSGDSR